MTQQYDDYGNPVIDLRQEIKKSLREETEDQAAQYQGYPNAAAMREAIQRKQQEEQKWFNDTIAEELKKYGVDPREIVLDEEEREAKREAIRRYAELQAKRKGKKAASAQRGGPTSQLGPDYRKVEFSEEDKKEFKQSNKGTTRDLEVLLRKQGI
jgi:hypothetical protein